MCAKSASSGVDLDAFRMGKAYTYAEAARLVKTSPQNVRRWMHGYVAPGHRMEPVFGSKERDPEAPAVSFLELVELAVASEFRRAAPGKQAVPLKRVRDANTYIREHFELPYPFASMILRQEGGHILHDFEEAEPGEGTLVVTMGGQWLLPNIVQRELDDLDYEGGLAAIWFPFGRQVPILVNPLIAAGSPTVSGTGVRVRTPRERVAAGERIEYLSRDYDIPRSRIEQVLQYAA